MADAAAEVFTDLLGLYEFSFVADAGQMHLIDHRLIISGKVIIVYILI